MCPNKTWQCAILTKASLAIVAAEVPVSYTHLCSYNRFVSLFLNVTSIIILLHNAFYQYFCVIQTKPYLKENEN